MCVVLSLEYGTNHCPVPLSLSYSLTRLALSSTADVMALIGPSDSGKVGYLIGTLLSEIY